MTSQLRDLNPTWRHRDRGLKKSHIADLIFTHPCHQSHQILSLDSPRAATGKPQACQPNWNTTCGHFTVEMKTVYIVSDSRGANLLASISPPTGFRFKMDIQGGATLQDLLKNTKNVINIRPCELVYILGGICSITQKENNIISLPFETTDEIYQSVKNLFRAVITGLDSFDSTPVILCPLVGVDLKMANDTSDQPAKKRKRGNPHPKQSILDEAIIKLNEYIRLLNSERGRKTPELDSAVHRRHGSDTGWKHSYGRLRDGIHPTQKTMAKWAKRFQENLGQFTK